MSLIEQALLLESVESDETNSLDGKGVLNEKIRTSKDDKDHLPLKKVCKFKGLNLWKASRARGVYGGQIVGQGIMAAGKDVPKSFDLHSMHSYFLLPINPNQTLIYNVHSIRDGI